MTKAQMRVILDDVLVNGTMDAATRAKVRSVRVEMHNRTPTTRGKVTSKPVTPAMRSQVAALHAQFPDLPQHELGRKVDTNQGRISNILSGVRT